MFRRGQEIIFSLQNVTLLLKCPRPYLVKSENLTLLAVSEKINKLINKRRSCQNYQRITSTSSTGDRVEVAKASRLPEVRAVVMDCGAWWRKFLKDVGSYCMNTSMICHAS